MVLLGPLVLQAPQDLQGSLDHQAPLWRTSLLTFKMLDTLPFLESGAHLALLALQDHQVSLELASCPMLTSPTAMSSGVS